MRVSIMINCDDKGTLLLYVNIDIDTLFTFFYVNSASFKQSYVFKKVI